MSAEAEAPPAFTRTEWDALGYEAQKKIESDIVLPLRSSPEKPLPGAVPPDYVTPFYCRLSMSGAEMRRDVINQTQGPYSFELDDSNVFCGKMVCGKGHDEHAVVCEWQNCIAETYDGYL